jgi:hypothetical protein
MHWSRPHCPCKQCEYGLYSPLSPAQSASVVQDCPPPSVAHEVWDAEGAHAVAWARCWGGVVARGPASAGWRQPPASGPPLELPPPEPPPLELPPPLLPLEPPPLELPPPLLPLEVPPLELPPLDPPLLEPDASGSPVLETTAV